MNKSGKIVLLFLMISICFACRKNKTQETDTETESAAENFLASSIGNDLNNIADEAGRTKSISSYKNGESFALLSVCASVQFDTLNSSNADTLTVNFGTVNCLCNDGRYRRGSILITYMGKYKDSLTTITIVPENYFVNDNGVIGSKTIKNMGHNSQGHLIYNIIENIMVTKADNTGTIEFNAVREREWLTGENTLTWSDDIYSITGTSTGKNANGRSFTSNITKPLIRNMSSGCRKHFISGTIVHTPSQKPARTIDFGDGSCDNKATVTINKKVYDIILP